MTDREEKEYWDEVVLKKRNIGSEEKCCIRKSGYERKTTGKSSEFRSYQRVRENIESEERKVEERKENEERKII